MEYLQKLNKLNVRLSKNTASRELCLEIMEDMRNAGMHDLHLKYLEKYDSLKAELAEIDKEFHVLNAAEAA